MRLIAVALLLAVVSAGRASTTHVAQRRSPIMRLAHELAAKAARRLPADPSKYDGSLSPDGKYFARLHEYVRPGSEGTQGQGIQLLSATGKLADDLTYPEFYRVDDFTWSNTSQAVYFWVNGALDWHSHTGGVWKMDVRTGITTRPSLPWMPAGDTPHLPSFSPQGDSYLVAVPNPSDPHSASDRIYRIWMRSARVRFLATGFSPFWSPDGSWIVFYREPAPSARVRNRVWLMRPDGSKVHPADPPTSSQLKARLHSDHAAKIDTEVVTWTGGRGRMLVACSLWDEEDSEMGHGVWVVESSRRKAPWISGASVLMTSGDGSHAYLSLKLSKAPAAAYLFTFGK